MILATMLMSPQLGALPVINGLEFGDRCFLLCFGLQEIHAIHVFFSTDMLVLLKIVICSK